MSLVLRSSLLARAGFRHGFSLRTDGVSRPPFDTLNLARNLGDDPQAVIENHRRLAGEVGYAVEALREVSQVHGCIVQAADCRLEAHEFRKREGDAVWTKQRELAVGVRVADCVPLLLASPETGAVAAVHAGWRGLVAQVIGKSVQALCEAAGVHPSSLLAAYGPHIGGDAFEVHEDVARQIAACAPDEAQVITWREPRPCADLGRVAQAQLGRAGLPASQIEHVAGCTFRDRERFFSFRRDGQASGRHLAVIVAGC